MYLYFSKSAAKRQAGNWTRFDSVPDGVKFLGDFLGDPHRAQFFKPASVGSTKFEL